MLLAWILITFAIYDAESIKLSVFDSPSALKNILLQENLLVEYLVKTYSEKITDVEFLTYAIDKLSKEKSWNIINLKGNSLARKNFLHTKSKKLILEHDIKPKLNAIHNFKDSNDVILSGAAVGLSLIQHIYNIDLPSIANGSIIVSNKELVRKSFDKWREKLSCFDFIILASYAIKVSWYEKASTYLNLVSDFISEDDSSRTDSYSKQYRNVIDLLSVIVDKGISMQQEDEAYEFETRFLPFSTSRFDFKNYGGGVA